MNRLHSLASSLHFCWSNWRMSRRLPPARPVRQQGLCIRPASRREVAQAFEIYATLLAGTRPSTAVRAALRLLRNPCLLLALQETDEKQQLVGINFYYFNRRDITERTIHEGFIGVLPLHAGKGVATRMREVARTQFRRAALTGISTRIKQSNAASLSSALRTGFEIRERHPDVLSDDVDLYLVSRFDS